MNGLIITVTSFINPLGQNSVMVLLHEEGIASGVPEMKNEKESRKLRRSANEKRTMTVHSALHFCTNDEILRYSGAQ
ncbi:hypothetical protein ACLB1M_06695 [Escherichia coli]